MQSIERKILKKHYRKNLDIIKKIQEKIYYTCDAEDELYKIVKRKINGCYKVNASDYEHEADIFFNIGHLSGCYLDNSETYKKAKDEVKLALETEFNDDRLSMTYEHCGDYVWDYIANYFKEEDMEIEYCDAGYESTGIKITIDYSDLAEIIDYDLDCISQLKNYRDYMLENAVDDQKRLLKEFRLFKNKLKTKFEKIKELVKKSEFYLENCAQNQLEYDIDSYLEENQFIIQKKIENIKFDYIADIKNGKIITNKKAVVDFEKAKDLLKKFFAGENVVGEMIDNFTILKVFDIKSIIFVRIGCHLIKIDKNLINQFF